MDVVRFLVSSGVIIAGLLSGAFWVRAACAKVAAKPGADEGVGYGGSPVNVRDHKGAVVDFLQTYTLQSKWNSRAALASAVTRKVESWPGYTAEEKYSARCHSGNRICPPGDDAPTCPQSTV